MSKKLEIYTLIFVAVSTMISLSRIVALLSMVNGLLSEHPLTELSIAAAMARVHSK